MPEQRNVFSKFCFIVPFLGIDEDLHLGWNYLIMFWSMEYGQK